MNKHILKIVGFLIISWVPEFGNRSLEGLLNSSPYFGEPGRLLGMLFNLPQLFDPNNTEYCILKMQPHEPIPWIGPDAAGEAVLADLVSILSDHLRKKYPEPSPTLYPENLVLISYFAEPIPRFGNYALIGMLNQRFERDQIYLLKLYANTGRQMKNKLILFYIVTKISLITGL